MENSIRDLAFAHVNESVSVLQGLVSDEDTIGVLIRAAQLTANAMLAGRKLMVGGNGGSAADAQHLVAEFVSRLTVDRPAMRAIALTTDTSILTAIGNDYGYDRLFARQLEALGQQGDVFLGISTSGNSPNVLAAIAHCRSLGIHTIALTGNAGGQLAVLCDYSIVIPSTVTAHIQESHLVLEHIFCTMVERCYFGFDYFDSLVGKELVA